MRSPQTRGVRASVKSTAVRIGLAGAAAALFAPAAALAHEGGAAMDAGAEADGVTVMSGVTVDTERAQEASSDPRVGEVLDAPQTVTIVPREVIEQRNATTLRDVLRNVPGISIQAGEGGVPNGDNLTLRGFSARTDIFVDGVRDLGGYFRDSFNLESVEVIKGPASAQSGRGSTGGLINQVNKLPQLERFLDVNAGLGTDAYGRVTVDLNQPLETWVEGAALRLNLMYHTADAPGRDFVTAERWGVAPTLALGIGTPTRVVFSWYKLVQDNTPDYGIPWVPATASATLAPWFDRPAPVPLDTWYGLARRDYEKTDTDIGTVRLEHDLSDQFTLTQTFRFVSVDRDSIVTAPRFVAGTTDITSQLQSRDQVDENFTSQTNLIANLGEGYVRHGLLFGLEFVEESSINYLRAHTGAAPATTPFDDPDPFRAIPSPVRRTGAFNAADSSTVALYVFDTIKFGEAFEITGGVRWDSFDMTYDQVSAALARTRFESSDDQFSYRLGAVWHPVPDASVYVSYGTSFNPSAEGLTLSATTTALPPEESETWEIGAKWDILDKRLLVSTALFRTDKTNARTTDPITSTVTLTGEQRVQGFEIGLTGDITPDWMIFAGYTFLDSEILDSANPAEIGNQMPNTPENSFSLWTAYKVGDRFELGLGAQFVDARFNNNSNARSADAYWLWDATAAWNVTDKAQVRLNLYNLADEEYFDSIGGGHLIPGAARSAVVSVGYRF